jgi:hypothetical protein
VQLADRDGSGRYDITFPPQPYVQDGAIVILPGETLIFRIAVTGDSLGPPVFVGARADPPPAKVLPSDTSFQGNAKTTVQHDPKTGENYYQAYKGSPYIEGGTAAEHLKDAPPGTLIVSYHQAAGHPDMILRVEHNLPKPVKYDAVITRPAANSLASGTPTSTCPVRPLVAGMESWPYPLGAVALRNLRFMDISNGFSCT